MSKLLSELAKGPWSSATAYTVGDIVDYLSSSYICILNGTNHTPPNATYWALLAGGMEWKGAWVAGTYTYKQIVSYNGSAFIVNKASTSETPSIGATDWDLLTSKGDTGIQGNTGAKGDTGVSIKGDTGADSTVAGPKGDTGVGLKGDTGVSIKGDTGAASTVKGDTGVTGGKGDTGASIKGDTGTNGAKGDTGIGTKGDTGIGTKGDTGAASTVKGDTGVSVKGDTGASIKGDTGAASTVKGDTGVTGSKGDTGPQGIAGAGVQWHGAYDAGHTYVTNDAVSYNNSSYISKQDTNFNHLPTDTSWWDVWVSQGNKGDTGSTGSKGDTGVSVKGDTGAASTVKGDTGVTGNTGSKGDTGVSVKGDTGTAGSKGDTGIGTKGDTGVATKGDTGTSGLKGDTGVGTKGDTGTSVKGDTGTAGLKGDTGIGTKGDTGTAGAKGDTGIGTKGDTGVAGSTWALTPAPGSDHSVSGITCALTAHDAQNFGDACFINADSEAAIIDADAIASMSSIVMCADASIGANASGNYLLMGFARDDTWNWTPGGLIYGTVTGTTGNTMSQTAPTGTDDVIQILGVATHADRMYFNPQLVQVEHV